MGNNDAATTRNSHQIVNFTVHMLLDLTRICMVPNSTILFVYDPIHSEINVIAEDDVLMIWMSCQLLQSRLANAHTHTSSVVYGRSR